MRSVRGSVGRQVNDLNDHLAELVDTLDDMDGSVAPGTVFPHP